MPRPLASYPQDAPYAATLAPLLATLDLQDAFQDQNDPARWTLPLILALNRDALTRVHAHIAQLWIMDQLSITRPADAYAILSATSLFGDVDARALTLPSLRELLRAAAILHEQVLTGRIRTRAELALAVNARKHALTQDCCGLGPDYRIFLDRAFDALLTNLRP